MSLYFERFRPGTVHYKVRMGAGATGYVRPYMGTFESYDDMVIERALLTPVRNACDFHHDVVLALKAEGFRFR